jgi:hypothetical protein
LLLKIFDLVLEGLVLFLKVQLKESDSQQRWSAERDVELEEYRKLLPQVEQECNDLVLFLKVLAGLQLLAVFLGRICLARELIFFGTELVNRTI